MTLRSYQRAGRNRRSGAVLVAALVCLLIVMGILGAMLQGALRERRQLHRERDLRQTELLLRAGVERAVFRLVSDSDYRGETWNVPAEEIVGSGSARVTIEVSRPANEPGSQISVVAEYPAGNETSIRRSDTFTVPHQTPQNPE
jgi:hypothetical protein